MATKKSLEAPSTKSKKQEQSLAAQSTDSTSVPPLRPYDPYKRGPYNLLRHEDQKGGAPIPDDAVGKADWKELVKNSFTDLKAEYGDLMDLDDMMEMARVIKEQEKREYGPDRFGQKGAGVNEEASGGSSILSTTKGEKSITSKKSIK